LTDEVRHSLGEEGLNGPIETGEVLIGENSGESLDDQHEKTREMLVKLGEYIAVRGQLVEDLDNIPAICLAVPKRCRAA
jgi:hypothetical protein